MKTHRESNQPIEKAPGEYGLIEMDFSEEARALDRLPASIRTALAEAGASINAVSVCGEYLRGVAMGAPRAVIEREIIRAIRAADEAMAIEQGTMPGEFWRGRQIAMRAARGDSAIAKPTREIKARPVMRQARRFVRAPGAY